MSSVFVERRVTRERRTRALPPEGTGRRRQIPATEAFGVEWLESPSSYRKSGTRRRTVLAFFDLIAVAFAALAGFAFSLVAREVLQLAQPAHAVTPQSLVGVLAVPAVVIVIGSAMLGHYHRIKPFWTEARELARITTYSGAIAIALVFVFKADVSRIWLFSSIVALVVFAPLMRSRAKSVLVRIGSWYAPLVIVGDRTLLAECEEAINSDYTLGYKVVARIDATRLLDPPYDRTGGGIADLVVDVGRQFPESRLLLAFDHRDVFEFQQTLVETVSRHFEHVIVAKSMYGLPAINSELLGVDKYDTLFFRFSSGGIARHRKLLKRAIDIVGASCALLIASPLFILLSLLVRRDGGTAFYGSRRIGLNRQEFDCYKFRSMRADSQVVLAEHLERDPAARAEWDANFKLENDPRVTRLGEFIRKTSLDELPQFFNVLRGDMSLVGPRPILPDEITPYGPTISVYQGVRPGLTGLWQISGRSDLDYQDRINLNKWYVRNWSLWIDLTILVRTLPAVMASRGAV